MSTGWEPMTEEDRVQGYRMSFTMGGLFLNEAVAAAVANERLGDWAQAQEEIQSGDRLVSARLVSMDRAVGELVMRLRYRPPRVRSVTQPRAGAMGARITLCH